ncbi:hypothetical protein O181_050331 [Austropuccinia psidii MF-1]|uniref:CCHC-type domain-containing protein n=1 Tax=Austropuccinia psidii MF-1 TaxID=1389203 RepID=A0A9Q3DU50_9BASI|nr:hypothetical protein [Austropuccinia psidii MF-1]
MSFENYKYSVKKDSHEWCIKQSKRLKAIDKKININMRNHKLLTQLPGEKSCSVKFWCNKDCTIDEIGNTLHDVRKGKNIGKYLPFKGKHFRERQPFRAENKDKPREMVSEVLRKKNSCHNCGSKDHYSKKCTKAKKNIYAIEKVPGEGLQTEKSDSDSMGYDIRENSDDDQDPIEEYLGEYQEET